MSMPWNYYVRRNGVNITEYLKSRNCYTYKELCEVLLRENIEPPTEKEVERFFATVKKSKKPAPKKQTLGTKSTAKSASRHQPARDPKIKKPLKKKADSGKESEQN